MPQTRLEQIIDQIFDYVDECKPTPLSQTRIIVQKDVLLDLLGELKNRVPDEVRRYKDIVANRERIYAQAQEEAQRIIEEAEVQAQKLIDETEIMQSAYRQANDMIQNAKAEAERINTESKQASNQIVTGALNYSNNVLMQIESIMDMAYKETRETSEKLISALATNLENVSSNRKEIIEQLNSEDSADDEEDFDFPEDTFLNNVEE